MSFRMKNKQLAKTQDELRGTRSRSRTPTQVLGTLLRNTSLLNATNDLPNSAQSETSLVRGSSLRSVNVTSDNPNASQSEQNSDDTDFEISPEQRESNRSQFAKKKKKEKAWDHFEKIDASTYRCKLCQRENVIILIFKSMHI
jgi:hypothetical protein